jgi:hypothetical protein
MTVSQLVEIQHSWTPLTHSEQPTNDMYSNKIRSPQDEISYLHVYI